MRQRNQSQNKKHFGVETSEEIKQSIKNLKTMHKITTMFGIRQIRYKLPHKTIAGKWFHKRQLDTNNLVFVHVTEDEFTAKFSWAGEEISVVVTPHRGELSVGQSVGVGYYTSASADAELAERLLELKFTRAANPIESDTPLAPTEEAPIADEDSSTHIAIAEPTCDRKKEHTPPVDSVQPARTPMTRTDHRKKYIHRTEYDLFQELCRNNAYGDETVRPAISLGLSFQLPPGSLSTGASTP